MLNDRSDKDLMCCSAVSCSFRTRSQWTWQQFTLITLRTSAIVWTLVVWEGGLQWRHLLHLMMVMMFDLSVAKMPSLCVSATSGVSVIVVDPLPNAVPSDLSALCFRNILFLFVLTKPSFKMQVCTGPLKGRQWRTCREKSKILHFPSPAIR